MKGAQSPFVAAEVGKCPVYERRRSRGETGCVRGKVMQKGGCATEKRGCRPQDRKLDAGVLMSWASWG